MSKAVDNMIKGLEDLKRHKDILAQYYKDVAEEKNEAFAAEIKNSVFVIDDNMTIQEREKAVTLQNILRRLGFVKPTK